MIWECTLSGIPYGGAKNTHVRRQLSASAGGRCLDSLAANGREDENESPFGEAQSEPVSRVSYSLPGSVTCSNCAFHEICDLSRFYDALLKNLMEVAHFSIMMLCERFLRGAFVQFLLFGGPRAVEQHCLPAGTGLFEAPGTHSYQERFEVELLREQ